MATKIGLALGGGAARGLAHIGVIKALEKANIPIDLIVGSSIGGIVGALYAAEPKIYECIEKFDNYLHSEDFDKTRLELIKESGKETRNYFHGLKKKLQRGMAFVTSISSKSFISIESFKGNLERFLPDIDIEDCPLKLGLVCMDLETSEEIIYSSGSLIEAVMASSSIPGFFPPVSIDDRTLVDGSWVSPVPVDETRQLGADFVIGVDISPNMSDDSSIEDGWGISLQAAEGSRQALKRRSLANADFVIIVDVMDMHWADFSKLHRCILEGERVANEKIDRIKKAIFWKKLKSSLRYSLLKKKRFSNSVINS